MKKPCIGITSSYDAGKRKDSLRKNRELYYLNRSYVLSIERAGGIPFILPPVETVADADIDTTLSQLDGLLLTGGYDIHPRVYGVNRVHPKTEPLDWLRLNYELALVKRALHRELPILAICLGIQMVNVAAGGTLYQDIPSELQNPLIHSQKENRDVLTHWVEIDRTSRLYHIVKTTRLQTNSFHHQALAQVAAGFRAVAWTKDGIIEAIESTDKIFRLGIQWHPEELIKYPKHLALFKELVKQASY
ncbi:MAG: gamma-glutamyl-gamma-aminobutyrate hydrolase family protein [bacterium]|nr:gamma-glutamyl-gamma-aminobutyrate hydrolase family protein [bacterium]